jgi:hypothetical protein
MNEALHATSTCTGRSSCSLSSPPLIASCVGIQEQRNHPLHACMPATRVPSTHLTAAVGCACRDGEDELYYNMLLEEDPAHKLQINAVLGALVLTASSFICWLCGADPAGVSQLSRCCVTRCPHHMLHRRALPGMESYPLCLVTTLLLSETNSKSIMCAVCDAPCCSPGRVAYRL